MQSTAKSPGRDMLASLCGRSKMKVYRLQSKTFTPETLSP
jgi:hypothetical protein